MTSPTLSRSPSAHFAPTSASRRSYPNVSHLSLAPLTPKFPIAPADYDAYFDPSTSELHTSASLSHVAALPSPAGILSSNYSHRGGPQKYGRSRGNSPSARTRRIVKTNSSIVVGTQAHPPSGAVSSAGLGQKTVRLQQQMELKRDPSWLVQTGLALTEGSRESKGQLWLSKRDSSTSLHTPTGDDDQRMWSVPARIKPNLSRRSSRKRSKRDLTMTLASSGDLEAKAEAQQPRIVPDWVDNKVREEAAAEEMLAEWEEEEGSSVEEFYRDRYGMVSFEGQFDTDDDNSDDDEKALQEAVKKKGFRLGRWVDSVVDALVAVDDDEDLDTSEVEAEKTPVADRPTGRGRSARIALDFEVVSSIEADSMEAPPEKPQSVWEDAAWLGRLVVKTVRS